MQADGTLGAAEVFDGGPAPAGNVELEFHAPSGRAVTDAWQLQ
jgi:hypothetical protein